MTANSINEQAIRDQLVAAFTPYLTGSGNPVQVLFGSDIADMQEQSPCVIVKQSLIDRTPKFIGSAQYHAWVYEDVEVWVRVGDKNSTAQTSAVVENTHSLIEKKVVDALVDNPRVAGKWDFIQTTGPATRPVNRIVGSSKYRMRLIPVKARLING